MTGKGKKAVERLVLTEEGRRQSLFLLGLDQLPPKTTWATLKKIHLPALALGLPRSRSESLAEFGKKAGFEAAVLKISFGLPISNLPTAKQAADALIWKLLGVDSSGRRPR